MSDSDEDSRSTPDKVTSSPTAKETSSTPTKVTSSKIPIRVGSVSEASPKMSRIPTRFGCESPAKPKKAVETSSETSPEIKNAKSAGICERKITEPHRVTISESLPFAPTKGSEGDQVCNRPSENKIPVELPVKARKSSLNVLMEPRNLRENTSELRIAQSGCMISTLYLGRGSNQSLCPDKSCEEVGNVSEVDLVDNRVEDETDEISALNIWKPVSEYLSSEKSNMRTTEAQTSEASNIDDMDCIESGKYSVYSCEASKIPTIPGKIKNCADFGSIKIRHPTPINSSLAKFAAVAAGLPVSDFNPDIPVEGVPNDSSCKNRSPAEKGDLKRKDTYTVFTEESSKDMSINDGGDGNQISAEVEDKVEDCLEKVEMAKNVLCVNISRITPSVMRAVTGDKILPAFEVYPQALLLIPDVNNPGGYIATLKIANNSANMRAYKICVNKWANNALVIEPQYGILNQYSEIAIQIRNKSCNMDLIGGLSQKLVDDAILEIRSIEVFNIANQRQLSKLWRMAESSFRDSISSVKIRSINVLEPRNKKILAMFDEKEATILKDIMEAKYNAEILPKMVENRESHLVDIQLAILEKRVEKVWRCVQHMDFYLDIGLASTYLVALYFGVLPWVVSCFDTPDPPPDPCDSSSRCKFTRYLQNLFYLS